MRTITIPKTEYEMLKKYATAYFKIIEEITKTETLYPYDYKYIQKLTNQALKELRQGKCFKAESIDEALSLKKKKEATKR